MRVKTNSYGQPMFTDQQTLLVHAELINRPCPICKAVAGSNCVIGKPRDRVHMGRLPYGWDSIKFIESLEPA